MRFVSALCILRFAPYLNDFLASAISSCLPCSPPKLSPHVGIMSWSIRRFAGLSLRLRDNHCRVDAFTVYNYPYRPSIAGKDVVNVTCHIGRLRQAVFAMYNVLLTRAWVLSGSCIDMEGWSEDSDHSISRVRPQAQGPTDASSRLQALARLSASLIFCGDTRPSLAAHICRYVSVTPSAVLQISYAC